jgi:hypothetical protein
VPSALIFTLKSPTSNLPKAGYAKSTITHYNCFINFGEAVLENKHALMKFDAPGSDTTGAGILHKARLQWQTASSLMLTVKLHLVALPQINVHTFCNGPPSITAPADPRIMQNLMLII